MTLSRSHGPLWRALLVLLCVAAPLRAADDHGGHHAHDGHDHSHDPHIMGAVSPLPPGGDAAAFTQGIDLRPLRLLAVQHNQTLKTFDTWARQMLVGISGRSTLDGLPAAFVLMDMAARPEDYRDRAMIKIRSAPLRIDILDLETLSDAEKEHIRKKGTISLAFFLRPDVQKHLASIQAGPAFKASAVSELATAADAMHNLVGVRHGFPRIAFIPPASNDPDDHLWHTLGEVQGNVMGDATTARKGFDDALLKRVAMAATGLTEAWRARDTEGVARYAAELQREMPAANPAVYPSSVRLQVELVYNRLYALTLPGSIAYFIAFVMFVASSRSGWRRVRVWAMAFLWLALIVHTLGIAVRWWLVGSEYLPIKNQFESVMFAAWFSTLVGMGLEAWRKRSLFGAAAAFVGWISLLALFTVPYVIGADIRHEVSQVGGILMTYWLYIHVVIVTASYGLIGMGFLLSLWWLFAYYGKTEQLSKINPLLLSADGRGEPRVLPEGGINSRISFLSSLDACNLVILQMAFWMLGVGIVTGAIWADQAWGRPWGWDPKETFALVTWIVYLIVVHLRVISPRKAILTAYLSLLGFVVMLFNWIVINFFLVGLHSYA